MWNFFKMTPTHLGSGMRKADLSACPFTGSAKSIKTDNVFGVDKPQHARTAQTRITTTEDWPRPRLAWTFSLFHGLGSCFPCEFFVVQKIIRHNAISNPRTSLDGLDRANHH